jgi:DNA-directed RNA polymerase specialized sigma24 family protein
MAIHATCFKDTFGLSQRENEQAFLVLYDKYAASILGILVRMTSNRKLAEKCLDHSFTRIWSERQQYDPAKEKLFTWMTKIARSCAADEQFAGKNRSDLEMIDLVFATNIKTYLYRKMLAEPDIFWTSLDSEMRLAIKLVYFQSHSFVETAKTLGMTLEMLKGRIIKTIRQLKNLDQLEPLKAILPVPT